MPSRADPAIPAAAGCPGAIFLSSAFPRTREAGVDRVHLRRAAALGERIPVAAVVPTPWAPPGIRHLRAEWAAYARTAERLDFGALPVFYPRYLQLPGQWFSWAAIASMALGALPRVRRLAREGYGVLFAQTTLPDGCAAVLLGRWTGLPAVCLGRGSDLNLTARRSRLARTLLGWTVRRAAGVAVVAHDLARTLQELVPGASPPTVLYNGIDLERFAPGDRTAARRALGLAPEGPIVLFVGRLVAGKGLDVLLDAFGRLREALPGAVLAVVGDGPLRSRLAARAATLGLGDALRLAGERPYDEMPRWHAAADVLALPSEAEGFPNVVREALACGRPVVATPVGDVPRVVGASSGRLVPVGDAAALTAALATVLATTWDPEAIRDRVRAMSWAHNAAETHRFLYRALGTR